MPDPQTAVNNAYNQFKALKEGKNADYIPALAKVDPNLFGIALVTVDGKVYTAGDIKTRGLHPVHLEGVHDGAGDPGAGPRTRSRSGSASTPPARGSTRSSPSKASRSVVGTGAPEMNPLVNPGAISATSMVTGANADAVWKKIIGFHNDAAGRSLTVLQDVYKSESDTNQRNQAIGALMLAYGYIKTNWQQAVDLYTRQCSIGVNAKDLGDDGRDARRRRTRTR